jgi:hypothetical protein
VPLETGGDRESASSSQRFKISGSVPPTVVIAAGILLCVLVPTVIMWILPEAPRSGNATVLAISALVAAGARFSWLLGRGEPRMMELSFWTFTYLFMGLAPLIQMRSGVYPGTTPRLSVDLNSTAMVVVLVGIAFVWLGCLIPAKSEIGAISGAVNAGRLILLTTLALAVNAYYVMRVGAENFLKSRSELSIAIADVWSNTTIAAIVEACCTMPLLVTWLGLLQLRKQQKETARRTAIVLPVLVCAALLFSVNPVSSPRYLFGTVALSILAGLGAYSNGKRVRLMSGAFFLGLVFLFPLADAFRRSGTPDFSNISPMNSFGTGDFDAFSQLNNTVLFVQTNGVTWGRQAIGVVLFWVPRSWWPDKPMDTGILLAQYRGYSFENLSAPIWAEFFINGGWLLLIFGMFFLGIYMRRRDNCDLRLKAEGKRGSIIGLILPFYLFILLRGSLLQAMAHLVVIAACAVFVVRHQSEKARADDLKRAAGTHTRAGKRTSRAELSTRRVIV